MFESSIEAALAHDEYALMYTAQIMLLAFQIWLWMIFHRMLGENAELNFARRMNLLPAYNAKVSNSDIQWLSTYTVDIINSIDKIYNYERVF